MQGWKDNFATHGWRSFSPNINASNNDEASRHANATLNQKVQQVKQRGSAGEVEFEGKKERWWWWLSGAWTNRLFLYPRMSLLGSWSRAIDTAGKQEAGGVTEDQSCPEPTHTLHTGAALLGHLVLYRGS